jgi:hypothetical protein
MAFVREYNVIHLFASLPQGCHHLAAFLFFDSRIICALPDEQRRFDLFDAEQRRPFFHVNPIFRILRVADQLIPITCHKRLPIGGDIFDKCPQIRKSAFVNSRSESIWSKCQPDESGIAPITGTHNGNLLGIGDYLFNCPIHAVVQITLHLPGKLAVPRVDEGFPQPPRPSPQTPSTWLPCLIPPFLVLDPCSLFQKHYRQFPLQRRGTVAASSYWTATAQSSVNRNRMTARSQGRGEAQ